MHACVRACVWARVRFVAGGDALRLNVTARLEKLFPFLDADPHDGYVSMNEIMIWQVLRVERGGG